MSSTSSEGSREAAAEIGGEPPPTAEEVAEACLRQASAAVTAGGAADPARDALLVALSDPPVLRRAPEPARAAAALLGSAIASLGRAPGLSAELRQAAARRIFERIGAALLAVAEVAPSARFDPRRDDLPAAMACIDGLIREGSPQACFGVVYLEIEPNKAISELPLTEYSNIRSTVSSELRRRLRPTDLVFAASGYTWVLLLPGLVSPTQLTLASLKLLRAFEELHWSWHGESVPLRPSMGGAFYPDSGDSAHALLQTARLARFDAWRAGEAFAFGSGAEAGGESNLARLTQAIATALSGDQLSLFLQPQIDIGSGRCHSAEALLRWQRSDGSWVPPPLIVSAIARADLRPQFNRWLIQRALRQLSELSAAGIPVSLGINLVAEDAQDGELPEMIRQALATWDIDGARLVLEMTEGAMVAETQQVIDNLNRLDALGIRLSIDDFGTGYSAMAYLRRLPVKELKIDQVFVRRMLDGDEDREIVASIIRLAHQLGLEVVAEGVENAPMLSMLYDLGCDRAQGFLFSPPLDLAHFCAWWTAHSTAPAGLA